MGMRVGMGARYRIYVMTIKESLHSGSSIRKNCQTVRSAEKSCSEKSCFVVGLLDGIEAKSNPITRVGTGIDVDCLERLPYDVRWGAEGLTYEWRTGLQRKEIECGSQDCHVICNEINKYKFANNGVHFSKGMKCDGFQKHMNVITVSVHILLFIILEHFSFPTLINFTDFSFTNKAAKRSAVICEKQITAFISNRDSHNFRQYDWLMQPVGCIL
uniref:Uncharacterized protein n=1 Tax=Glossina brevipalpis TaxID=37001 RepID=A0A1A9WQA6_9MUSC